MDGGGKVVCVTGASGYIASWLVKLLLLRGYTVKATVRDPNDSKKTQHLLELDGAKERLKLFRADLLEEGSFDHAVDGCEGVFHTASPVTITAKDPQAELIVPAVKGTLTVLNSCTKVPSIKRVILTSSMAAVLYPKKTVTPDDVVDETFFSDPAVCETSKLWYTLSKTLAEDAAWKLAKENGIDLVTMNPGFVSGPLLQPTLNFSVEVIRYLINGKNPFNKSEYRWIDVRDVAFAHIQAFEIPSASGRYVLDGRSMTLAEMEKVFQEFYPGLHIAEQKEVDPGFRGTYRVTVEKAKSLGVEFTPVEASLRDTIVSLKEKGFLSS